MKFSEILPGSVFRAGPRAVGAEEIVDFATRYDPQPFHIDAERAASTRWKGLIASGWMTCGVAMELAVNGILDGSGSVGSPGIDELRWENPVRPGDELTLAVTVLESRMSSSGRTGIVRWRWEMHNQQGQRVLSLLATSLFDVAGTPTTNG